MGESWHDERVGTMRQRIIMTDQPRTEGRAVVNFTRRGRERIKQARRSFPVVEREKDDGSPVH
eukprot:764011-Hanusia_phi.AAC.4